MCMTDSMHIWSRFVDSGVYQDAGSIDRLALVASNDLAIVVVDQDALSMPKCTCFIIRSARPRGAADSHRGDRTPKGFIHIASV